MAQIIEIVRESEAAARSFLDALFYSDSVSAIGNRTENNETRAVAVNWDEDESSELDDAVSTMIDNALKSGEDLDEIAAYCRIYPNCVAYNPETNDEF